jgi:hypothetical protein
MKIFRFLIIVCLAVFLFSCEKYGGTIIIENDYDIQKYVTILTDIEGGYVITYKDKYGPKIVSAEGSVSFDVESNPELGTHSVMVSSIEFTKDKTGNITGISKINVANPYNDQNHFNGRSSYLPNEIVGWAFYSVTNNKK